MKVGGRDLGARRNFGEEMNFNGDSRGAGFEGCCGAERPPNPLSQNTHRPPLSTVGCSGSRGPLLQLKMGPIPRKTFAVASPSRTSLYGSPYRRTTSTPLRENPCRRKITLPHGRPLSNDLQPVDIRVHIAKEISPTTTKELKLHRRNPVETRGGKQEVVGGVGRQQKTRNTVSGKIPSRVFFTVRKVFYTVRKVFYTVRNTLFCFAFLVVC
jgi:hypothetical protein